MAVLWRVISSDVVVRWQIMSRERRERERDSSVQILIQLMLQTFNLGLAFATAIFWTPVACERSSLALLSVCVRGAWAKVS